MGVAASILDLVKESVPVADAPRVRAVRVRVGELSGVLPQSLAFCFEALVADTPYDRAWLDIVHVPARGRCADCGAPFGLSPPRFVCPACGGNHVAMTSGRELQVIEVELEQDAHDAGHDHGDGHGDGPAGGHGNHDGNTDGGRVA